MYKNGVVCAIDVNDYDQAVVDLAATVAGQFGLDLDLIHVTLFPDPANAAWPGYLASPNVLINEHRRLRNVKTNVPGVQVRHHHLSGYPVQKILDFVDKNESQMLVLGTHARRSLARLMGSVSTKILRQSNCPVMILRQRQNTQDFANLKPETI